MNSSKDTPMMRQYLSIKINYSSEILLYRMGDFYEMFFDDAKLASKILGIVLTSRNKNDLEPIPMCGFPYKSARVYISKLIKSGQKVAICDQINSTIRNKNLVERRVTRVITPGMVIDDDLLDGKKNNYILTMNYYKKMYGVAYIDISTGDFYVTESLNTNDILDEIIRIYPSEIILSKSLNRFLLNHNFYENIPIIHVSIIKKQYFYFNLARKILLNQFNVLFFREFELFNMYSAVGAAGALMRYINMAQRQKVKHIKPIKIYFLNNFLIIDKQSRRNLELFEGIRSELKSDALINVLDKTITPMGARLLKKWIKYPLVDYSIISVRSSAVLSLFNDDETNHSIRNLLKSVFDLERLASKISLKTANARDLNQLKESIYIFPRLLKKLSLFKSKLYDFNHNLDDLLKIENLINKSIRSDVSLNNVEGNIIKKGYNCEFDNLLNDIKQIKETLVDFEKKEKKSTSINSLKLKSNKSLSYYIEIPKAQVKNVPKNYICKQTLTNNIRYTTINLRKLESKIFIFQNRLYILEEEILKDIKSKIEKHTNSIQEMAHFISTVDCLSNFAFIARRNNYCKPILNKKGIINIIDGRHPVVEKLVEGERFVSNSIKIDDTNNQILLITGPNMSGKSTILRQIAISIIMAQIGSFVPAKKANLPIIDRIFTRVGALDNLAAGHSTFMVEMQEVATILNNSTNNSLVIIDEIGRGTSIFDGLSIAWSIIEFLHDLNGIGVKSIFATHYHELTRIEKYKTRVKNYNVAAKKVNDEIVFMRKLIRGSSNKSYGIQVASMAGLPDSVIERSKKIFGKLYSKNIKTNEDYLEVNLKSINHSKRKGEIISIIKNMDILETSPIKALDYLNTLKIKVKGLL